MLKPLLLFLALLLLPVCVWIAARTAWLIVVSERLQRGARAFEQIPETPQLSFLVLGDSTAFGTGAADNRGSLAGSG